MLQAAVSRARRRPWRLVALLALAVAALAGFVLAAFVRAAPDSDDKAVVPVAVPVPQPEPSLGPADALSIDEPIEYLAAASDAPVIAVASGHHVWISRDDGKTF